MVFYEYFKDKKGFYVPKIIYDLSTKHVLTSEWVDGVPTLSI